MTFSPRRDSEPQSGSFDRVPSNLDAETGLGQKKVEEATAFPRWLGSSRITVGLFLGLILVYVLQVSPAWDISSDAALYLCLARSLEAGEGYTYQDAPHAHAMPGLPLLLSGAMKLGWTESWQLKFVMLSIGLALCLSTWWLARLIADAATANLAVALIGLGEFNMRYSDRMLTEIPFTLLLVLVAICLTLAWRARQALSIWWASVAALIASGSFLFRANGLAIFPGLFAWLWITVPVSAGRWKRALLAGLFCVCAVAPAAWWALRCQRCTREYSSTYLGGIAKRTPLARAVALVPNAGRGGWQAAATSCGFSEDGVLSSFNWRWLMIGPCVLGMALGSWLLLRRRDWLLPVLVGAQIALVSAYVSSERASGLMGRYLGPVGPLACILVLVGFAHLLASGRRWLRYSLYLVLVAVLAARVGQAADDTFSEPGSAASRHRETDMNLGYYLRDQQRPLKVYYYFARNATWFSEGRHTICSLPRRLPDSAGAFPAFFCSRGGFDLLALRPEKNAQDAAVLAAAQRMAAWKAFELVEKRMPDKFGARIFLIRRDRGGLRAPRPAGAAGADE